MIELAWDTETALFRPGCMAPPLTCVSWAHVGDDGLMGHVEAKDWFKNMLLDSRVLLIGHNIAYDMAVICAEYPELIPLVFKAYEDDRVTCTMLRQMLLDNAVGRFRGYYRRHYDDKGKFNEKWISIEYSLDDCYFRATKKRLDKDTWRLRYGELRGVPLDQWEEGARHYPREDARATLAVFDWQKKYEADVRSAYLKTHTHVEDPQPLADQFRQARAAFWLHLMSVWGIKTAPERVEKLREFANEKLQTIRKDLQDFGLVRFDGTRDTKAAAARMLAFMGEDNVRRTETGQVQLDEESCQESGDHGLMLYAELSSLGSVISKDIVALEKGTHFPIHSRFSPFVATGRTSSSGPNIQNVRRLPGIRECFVPRPGKVFVAADYAGLELRTLAQSCMILLGRSRLAEVLNSGLDPHLMFATTILHIDYDEGKRRYKAKDKEVIDARQTGKVMNFGTPGGLGAISLVSFAKSGYGVVITPEEAKELKQEWFKTYPEMRDYFDKISKMAVMDNEGDSLHSIEQIFSKRLRGDCLYTAACNSFFQGLGSDATKAAGFLIAKECYVNRDSPLFGARIVNYIHDEFILECDEDKCDAVAKRLPRAMEEGAAPFLPDVPPLVEEVTVSRLWSKNAEKLVDKDGKFIPWDTAFEVESRG